MKAVSEIPLELLRATGALFLDFDGVLTDNRVLVSGDGTESVFCWRGDGIGIERVKTLGIRVFIISTEVNEIVRVRASKLEIPAYHGIVNKAEVVRSICDRENIAINKTLFIGNDANDIPAFKIVRIPVGVADISEEAKTYVNFMTEKRGGRGAVREICDALYNARST